MGIDNQTFIRSINGWQKCKFIDLSSGDMSGLMCSGFPDDYDVVNVLIVETLEEIKAEFLRLFDGICWFDSSGTRVKRFGCNVCEMFSSLHSVVLPATLEEIGAACFARSSLELLDLSGTSVRRLGNGVCRICALLREVLLPSMLREICGSCFWDSSLERLDLSGTSVERLGDHVCGECSKLREVLFPHVLRVVGAGCFRKTSLRRIDLGGRG
jgi:hypothetical protein